MARVGIPSLLSRSAAGRAGAPVRRAFADATATRRTALSWIMVGLLVAGGLVSVYLMQVSSVAMAGYDLERLEEERQAWIARNQQLEIELAKRRSLVWVETQAVHRLGMSRVPPVAFLPVGAADPTSSTIDQGPGSESAHTPAERPAQPRGVAPLDRFRNWIDELLSRHR